jgi:hypothetical protein
VVSKHEEVKGQQASSESEEEEDNSKEESKASGGFKKLQAPPSSKVHVLESVRNLKNKLQGGGSAAPT